MKLKITERGWAGHFICADRCSFRRNTLIEYGDKRIVVSTVGDMRVNEYVPDIDKKFQRQIGLDRYYETMAFEAKYQEPYWDADVSKEIYFESQWAINELEFSTDLKANEQHEKVVNELSNFIKK